MLMLFHQLTNFEIQKYYQNKPYFKGFYSRNGLPNIVEDETFVIDLHPNLGGLFRGSFWGYARNLKFDM